MVFLKCLGGLEKRWLEWLVFFDFFSDWKIVGDEFISASEKLV